MGDGGDELDRVLASEWSGRVPDSESRLAGRLSKTMRDKVARRMQVLLRRERSTLTARALAADVAADLGLSRPRFYAMAKEYYETRSIEALGARAAEKPTRPARLDPALRSEAIELIGVALRDDPDASITSIALRLANAGVGPLSYSMVRRLWLEARRSGPPGPFGAELLFDSVGLDAISSGERLRLYVLLDDGTGLVLGAAVAKNASRSKGFVMAAIDAGDAVSNYDLDGLSPAVGEPNITFHRQRDDVYGASVLEHRLRLAGFQCEVHDVALGRAIVQVVGERLGSVWLGTGERDDDVSYRNGRRARMPEYTEALGETLKAHIVEHNRRRLKAIPADVSPMGPMQPVLDSISRVIRVVADAGKELASLPSYSETSTRPAPASGETPGPHPER